MQAQDGCEAIEIYNASKDKLDCIITDLLMPKMTGTELIRKIRETNMTIPLIVVTADIQNSTRTDCLEMGVQHFMAKPISQQGLVSAVKLVLEKEPERSHLNDING